MIKKLSTALFVFLLGSVACHWENIPLLTPTPRSNPSSQNASQEASTIPTMTPVLPAENSIPPTIPKPSILPLSGSGGGVIAFQSDRDRQDEIYVMNADGSEQRLLISNQWALDSMPAWSPDGAQIAFASRDRGKDFEISVISVAENLQGITGEAVKLTNNDFDDIHPTWSPDGSQIAFCSKRDIYNDIYVIDVDGTGEYQLTETQSNDKDPAWSLDGTLIAFVSNRDNDNETFVMKPDGSNQRALTDNDSNEWSPAWSPDGNQIAFISDRNGQQDLYLMASDGSNARRLTGDSYPWNDDPAWSPDGNLIAFRSNRNDQVDIYIIQVDGSSTPQQLTHNREIDQDRAPVWYPVSPLSLNR
jgi:Tol biopolymer transport system component